MQAEEAEVTVLPMLAEGAVMVIKQPVLADMAAINQVIQELEVAIVTVPFRVAPVLLPIPAEVHMERAVQEAAMVSPVIPLGAVEGVVIFV
jgi:hypothetical protein